ncbi:alanine dehydrogenase [Microbacterium aerolatum]|uniref:alanine dehydrogenase n=1 Tax=Microbacterium aerolatum TaxID=153731 RepID=UPI00385046FB
MRIGVPTEVKNNEYRVAAVPATIDALVRRGHQVYVQSGAGEGARIRDADFARAGAEILASADEVWAMGDLLLKVKEPIASEYALLREDQTLFTYLHLAASRELTAALCDAGTTAIAYETVQLADRSLPLLAPMSEVAGRLSIQAGAYHLMSAAGGRGVLLGGIPGARKANVVVIGGGVAGEHAARNALGLGARVTVVDVSLPRLRQLEAQIDGIQTRYSSHLAIAELLEDADLVIGSVLIPGATAPKLVTDEMVARMRPGSVLVDIAIDQGGCFEGSRPTTHESPVFGVYESLYYCVANMPGAVPETSTAALTNATAPYVLAIADKGGSRAMEDDPNLARGLSTRAGRLTNAQVGEALDIDAVSVEEALAL